MSSPRPRFLATWSLLGVALLTSSCWLVKAAKPEASPSPVPPRSETKPFVARPLPGGLDATPCFNSNSPEVVTQAGVLLASGQPATEAERQVMLPVPLVGSFTVFSQHIAKDALPGARLLHLGLVARNPGPGTAVVSLLRGGSYLSQPDAPFWPKPPLVVDPKGEVYAGPGDRVSTEWLHGRGNLPPFTAVIPAGASLLLYDLPIPTSVTFLPPINGRATMLSLHTDRPLTLAEVALYAKRNAWGGFEPTKLEDFQALLAAGTQPQPREPGSDVDANNHAAPGVFHYGRVAGVQAGVTWRAQLFADASELPNPGQTLGFPIATPLAKRFGTQQVQSAPLLAHYPGTAAQAHGNYAVTYELSAALSNPDPTPRTYTFALSQPAKVDGQAASAVATFLVPPPSTAMFRGSVAVEWRGADGKLYTQFTHLVLHHGERGEPFARLVVAPGQTLAAKLRLIYPGDATPPQLLEVGRE